MSVPLIRSKLEEVLRFLQPYMSFINCHMVDYLTGNLWEVHIPQKIKDKIRSELDVEEAIEAFWSQGKFPENQLALGEFIEEAESHSLENCAELCDQDDLFKQLWSTCKDGISIKEFMSEKKGHEVETAAKLVHGLIKSRRSGKEIYVVDAGDGKGYLSSRLALQYHFKVLGIDANEVNTEGAKKRSSRLERAWNGLTQRASFIKEGKTPPRRRKRIIKEEYRDPGTENLHPTTSKNYKTINEFIVPDLDLATVIRNHFNDAEDPEICLCGLHTCGNLAATCLELFYAQESTKILFNVGCCYHLLNEKFSKDDLFVNQEIAERNPHRGFPMSTFLQEKSFRLGRNARMLASQSIHRTRKNKELPNKSLFYRALLEVLIKQNAPELGSSIQVGKIRKFESFEEYVEKCSRKFNNLGISSLEPSDYNSLIERYCRDAKLLDLFYLIRMTFAPVIETVILLDRLLFLKENEIDKSFLVPLFDPVISPRRFAIVSLKQ